VESPFGGKVRVPLPRTQVVLQGTHILCYCIYATRKLEEGIERGRKRCAIQRMEGLETGVR